MRVERDFEEFVALLNAHKVRYLIVGAYAISFHAEPRNTGDVDLFVDPAEGNARRLLEVLDRFGFGDLEITKKDLWNPDLVIQFGREPNRIDLLTSISGVAFRGAYSRRVVGRFGRTRANFISLPDLLRNKKASGRPKDIADIDLLQRATEAQRKKKRSPRSRA